MTKRTSVYPQFKLMVFTCERCKSVTPPIANNGVSAETVRPGRCPECQSEGPFVINGERTVYRNYQKLTLQVGCAEWRCRRARGCTAAATS